MFDVLMYLFETYIHSDVELMVEQDELAEELSVLASIGKKF